MRPAFDLASNVVRWMGAMQAQDYQGAKWSLGLRLHQATDASVEAEISEGRILRTHVLRPTWHFVAAEDIRWLLEVTSPRVKAATAYMRRRLRLDDETFKRSNKIMADALHGKNHLTRVEIGKELTKGGITTSGLNLIFLLMNAELDAVICNGPRRGKQFTYALVQERAPKASERSRDEALAELAVRYFTSHGPATRRDFVWWSGLTTVDATKGLEMADSRLVRDTVDGEASFSSPKSQSGDADPLMAFLLPAYDEMMVGYSSFDRLRRGGEEFRDRFKFSSPIMVRGRVVGSWRRELVRRAAMIQLAPYRKMEPDETEALHMVAERYGRFFGWAVELEYVAPKK
jgi:Winged helix DNA-binding domain